MIRINKSIINSLLPVGSLITGMIEENRGLILKTTSKVSIDEVPSILDVPFMIKNTGEGSFSLYLETFNDQKVYTANQIISEIKNDYQADISIIFNTAFLEDYTNYLIQEEEEIANLELLLEGIFEKTRETFTPDKSLINDIALLVLLYKLSIFGDKLGEVNKSAKGNISDIFDFIKKTNFYSKEKNEALFFIQLFLPSNKFKNLDWIWLKNAEEIISKAIYKFPKHTQKIIAESFLSFFDSTINHKGYFTNSNLINHVIGCFIKPEKSRVSLYDPCAGIGNTLIHVFNQKLNQDSLKINAKEVDEITFWFLGLNLLINNLGIEGIKQEDSLNSEDYNVHDLICAVPPMGRKLKTQNSYFSKIEDAFINHALETLSPNGVAYLIIPEVFLTRNQNELRKKLIKENLVDGIISLPSLEKRIDVSLVLLILKNNRLSPKVFMANLSGFQFTFQKFKQELEYIKFLQILNKTAESYKANFDIDEELIGLIPLSTIEQNNLRLNPRYYLFEGKDKLDFMLSGNHFKPLNEVLLSTFEFRPTKNSSKEKLNRVRLIGPKKFRNNNNLYFDLSLSEKDLYLVADERVLQNDTVLVSKNKIELACIFKSENDSKINYSLGNGMIGLIPDKTQILPQYLVKQLRSRHFKLQLKKLHSGSRLFRYSLRQLTSIQVKVPPIETQIKSLAIRDEAADLKDGFLVSEEAAIYRPQIPIDKAIQHYIRNQIRPVDTYMGLLRDFIDKLPGNAEGELWTKGINEASEVTLRKVYHKISYFHKDLENIVTNFEDLGNLQKELIFERRSLKKVLGDLTERYSDEIEISISGDNVIIPINEFAFSIIIENLLSNAAKHGFVEEFGANPKIEFEIIRHQQNKIVDILYKNNGKPFPYSFNFNDFLNVDKRAGENAGMGLGGNLIDMATRKHEGTFEPVSIHGRNLSGWNVTFKISLDLNKLL